MIIRILGEGQLDVPESALDQVNGLDSDLEAAVESGDEERFGAALAALLDGVRTLGRPHDPDSLEESDVILPPADARLDEVREMLGDEGLIPG